MIGIYFKNWKKLQGCFLKYNLANFIGIYEVKVFKFLDLFRNYYEQHYFQINQYFQLLENNSYQLVMVQN